MAPGGGGKRKRGDRTYSNEGREEGSRPSPHRPGNLALGQQSNQQQGQQSQNHGRDQYDQRGGGRRRGSRGGRGGGPQRSPINSPNAIPLQPRANNASPGPMPPSFPPPQSQAGSKPEPALQALATNTAIAQVLEQQQNKPAPYYYEYTTEERIGAWVDHGKKEVLNIGVTARTTQDALTLGILYQELVRSGLDGRIDAAEAGSTIKDILKKDDKTDTSDDMADEFPFDASSLFLDCLSILTEASPSIATPSLKTIVLATGIPAQQMRRELDSTLLENFGMIRNTFVRVGIRTQPTFCTANRITTCFGRRRRATQNS